jgi:hypothetical protein
MLDSDVRQSLVDSLAYHSSSCSGCWCSYSRPQPGPTAAAVILLRNGLAGSAATYTWFGVAVLAAVTLFEFAVLVVLSGWSWSKRDLARTLAAERAPN